MAVSDRWHKSRPHLQDTARCEHKVTFRAFAEDWRRSRTHDVVTAARVGRQLRLHVYPVIGDRTLRELGKRPSVVQAWISELKLAPSSARQVIRDGVEGVRRGAR